jgi:hypothetical protein
VETLEDDPHPATAVVAIRTIGSSARRGIASRQHGAVVRTPPGVATIVETGRKLPDTSVGLSAALQYSRTRTTGWDNDLIANARLRKHFTPPRCSDDADLTAQLSSPGVRANAPLQALRMRVLVASALLVDRRPVGRTTSASGSARCAARIGIATIRI